MRYRIEKLLLIIFSCWYSLGCTAGNDPTDVSNCKDSPKEVVSQVCITHLPDSGKPKHF